MPANRQTPFTPEEIESMPPYARRLVNSLGDIWNDYCRIRTTTEEQRDAFCDAIHQCQDLILEQTGKPGAEINNESPI